MASERLCDEISMLVHLDTLKLERLFYESMEFGDIIIFNVSWPSSNSPCSANAIYLLSKCNNVLASWDEMASHPQPDTPLVDIRYGLWESLLRFDQVLEKFKEVETPIVGILLNSELTQ